jgi:hypothetical protein
MQSNDPNAPNIDLETLRASARQADAEKNAKKQAQQSQQQASSSTKSPKTQDTMSQHQTSFQILPPPVEGNDQNSSMPPTPTQSSQHQRIPPPPPSSSGSRHSMGLPQPSWGPHAAQAPPQHQSYSYMRADSSR